MSHVRFSPDGKQLATGSWSGGVKIWDMPNATETQRFQGIYLLALIPESASFAQHPIQGIAIVLVALRGIRRRLYHRVAIWSIWPAEEATNKFSFGHLARRRSAFPNF